MTRFAPAALIVCVCTALAWATDTKSDAFKFPETPPQAPPLRPPAMPEVDRTALDNGMEVFVVPNDEVPFVSIRWYLTAGSRFDPAGKEGLASLTAGLLRQGTENYTDEKLAERLDFDAILLEGEAAPEYSVVSAGCMSDQVDLTVELMADVIRRPTFPPAEFRRRVQDMISNLAVEEREPDYMADRKFAEVVYGSHYLSRPVEGTTRTMRAIRTEDVSQFHAMHYMPNRSRIIFSGDIAPEKAVALTKQYFGDWEKGEPVTVPPPQTPAASDTRIVLVHRPDAIQSKIRVGHLGIRRADPRYIVSRVFNQVFGAGFDSRLNKRIRVDEGLTYGARGGVTAEREPGLFRVWTFSRTEETGRTLKLILEEIDRIRTDPPTSEELSAAQSYLVGSFSLGLETPQDVAFKVFERVFYSLPDDYYEQYLQRVPTVSAEEVISFAQDLVKPDQLVIVVVGDATKLSDELEAIAPVTRAE